MILFKFWFLYLRDKNMCKETWLVSHWNMGQDRAWEPANENVTGLSRTSFPLKSWDFKGPVVPSQQKKTSKMAGGW